MTQENTHDVTVDGSVLGSLDPDLVGRMASKSDLFGSTAAKLGILATTPVLLAAVSTQTFGQGLPAQVVDILNFALTLEYLEDGFYKAALSQPGLIPSQFVEVFSTISKHESQHVSTLQGALGGAAVAMPKFDLTGRGRYPDILSNFRTFALVSQTLEDVGVAAYKGQAPRLTGGGDLLTTALRIHSVEARHAAEVRRVRGVKSWSGAFDKPMSKAQVLAMASPFIAG
jgi:hypothetical protein